MIAVKLWVYMTLFLLALRNGSAIRPALGRHVRSHEKSKGLHQFTAPYSTCPVL